jgi:hypothetical protein
MLSWHAFAFGTASLNSLLQDIRLEIQAGNNPPVDPLELARMFLDAVTSKGRFNLAMQTVASSDIARELASRDSAHVNARCKTLLLLAARTATAFDFGMEEVCTLPANLLISCISSKFAEILTPCAHLQPKVHARAVGSINFPLFFPVTVALALGFCGVCGALHALETHRRTHTCR